jgi:hypothetical protein
MTQDFNARSKTTIRISSAAVAVTSMLLLSGCQISETSAGPATSSANSSAASSSAIPAVQGSIVSADGLYQLMPDFHCRDDGPDSEDTRCLTLDCPATAESAAEGRPVIWKRASRTIVSPGWQDWVPVSGPTCFYDPHACAKPYVVTSRD